MHQIQANSWNYTALILKKVISYKIVTLLIFGPVFLLGSIYKLALFINGAAPFISNMENYNVYLILFKERKHKI